MAQLFKRKQYFIDKPFQTRFIMRFCLIVLAASVLSGILLFFLSYNSTTVAIENTRVMVKRTSEFILPILISTILTATFFAAVAVLFLTLFASHKIAGPLFRLKREIDGLKQGDLMRNFSIRSDDQLQDFAKSLRDMCGSLREKHQVMKDKKENLKRFFIEKESVFSPEDKKRLWQLMSEVEGAMDSFKL
jgi:methyl-accepting chemotaxis protein